MNFIKTVNLLTAQAEGEQVSLEAALELIRTYLTELRHHTGVSLEKCPLEDRLQATASLTAVSNDLNYVFAQHQQTLLQDQDRYAQALVRAHDKLEGYTRGLAQLDGQLEQGEALNQQLSRLLAQQSEKEAALEALHRENRQLQEKLDALNEGDPETAQGKLLEEIRQKTQCLEQRRSRYAQDQKSLEEVNKQLSDLQTRQWALDAQVKEKEADLQEGQEQLRRLEQQKEELLRSLESRDRAVATLEQSLVQEKENAQSLLSRLEELEMSVQAKQTDNRIFRESHVVPEQRKLEAAVAQAEAERQQLQLLSQELQQKETERQTVAAEAMLLQSQLSKKEKQLQLERSNHQQLQQSVEDMEAQLRDMANALTPLLNREKELQQRLEGKSAAQLQEEISSSIAKLEQEQTRLEGLQAQLEEAAAGLEQLRQKRAGAQGELDQITRSRQDLQQQYDRVAEALEEAVSPEMQSRCRKLVQQTELLRSIMKTLEGQTVCGGGFAPPYGRLEQAEQIAMELRKAIQDYTALRQGTIET